MPAAAKIVAEVCDVFWYYLGERYRKRVKMGEGEWVWVAGQLGLQVKWDPSRKLII